MLCDVSLGAPISPTVYGCTKNRILGAAISELHIDSIANPNINYDSLLQSN